MKKNLLIVALIVTTILLLDQILKIHVKSTMEPGESFPLIGDWFVMEYIENPGMAFGTTFGSTIWAKLSLSIFRIIAITAIVYYLIKQARQGVRLEFLVAVSLVLAGATGNLIDSMLYDYIFPVDQYLDCFQHYNRLEGSGNYMDCGIGQVEIRNTGFLFGNVVDMFQFQATWPSWMPWLGGSQVFPAIWNVADASITLGVIMVFVRQRKYFPKSKKPNASQQKDDVVTENDGESLSSETDQNNDVEKAENDPSSGSLS